MAENQASGSYWYQVLQKDNSAHVVKINNSPRQGETQYGYVFFDKSARTLGPVRRVEKVKLVIVWSSLDKRSWFNETNREDEIREYMERLLLLKEKKDFKRSSSERHFICVFFVKLVS